MKVEDITDEQLWDALRSHPVDVDCLLKVICKIDIQCAAFAQCLSHLGIEQEMYEIFKAQSESLMDQIMSETRQDMIDQYRRKLSDDPSTKTMLSLFGRLIFPEKKD